MRVSILISLVCVLTAFGSAGPGGPGRTVQPGCGFDPKDVVRQVRTRSGDVERLPGGQVSVPYHPNVKGRGRSVIGGELSLDHGEFLLDTNSALVPAPGGQDEPAVAFDGTNFLVVWEDHRGGGYSDIWGARVTPGGEVLDISGFIISQAKYDQWYPALAFDGANFLVVWQDYRAYYYSDIYGARVTPGGAVLDPSGIVISQAQDDEGRPALGFDGANYLVAWEDYRNGDTPDIYGARVMPGGTVLDPEGFAISRAIRGQYSPAVGFGGLYFTVVWQDCRTSAEQADIYGALVTPEGTVPDTAGFAVSRATGVQGAPAIAFDGTNFLVAWQDLDGAPPVMSIYGARVTPWGVVQDPGGIAIADGTGGTHPALGFDGASFLVVWYEVHGLAPAYMSIWGARVTPGGEVLDEHGIVISASAVRFQQMPVTGFGGASFLVVWQDDRNVSGVPDIYGARVTPEGEVLDTLGFVIPQAARDQLVPVLAFDGANYLVVWEDHRSGNSDIYGARVTPGGAVLDPDGLVISGAPNQQRAPALAFDGANYLVAWEDQRGGSSDIYGTRVTPGGVVLNTDGIVISDAAKGQYSPALGFDGANYLVVWEDNRSGEYADLYGTRVTPGGIVLNSDGIVISQADIDQWYPALAYDGANYLVVWQDYRGGHADLYGARVTPQGGVLDPQGIIVSNAALDQATPALVFDGTNFLVVWTDYRSGVYSDIFGARVTRQGTVLDPEGFGIWRAAQGQVGPALGLGFDGTNYLVVWEDYRSDQPDIFGAMVTPAGVVIDSGWVVKQEGNQLHPKLARGPGSDLFLVYQGWVGTLGGKLYNTDRTWGEMNPTITGIKESQPLVVYGSRPVASIVRGVLVLGAVDGRQNTGYRAALLDAAGRKVLDLSAGANDVSKLAPGVYFVRDGQAQAQAQAQTVRKVVIAK